MRIPTQSHGLSAAEIRDILSERGIGKDYPGWIAGPAIF